MKVVFLASGRSLRMKPIPDKNFLKFFGKPLCSRQLKILARASFKEILVIGGRHNLKALQSLIKSLAREKEFKNVKLDVGEQEDLSLGMAGAILSAASWIADEPFLLVSSNDIVDQSAYDLIYSKSKKGDGLLLAYKVKKYFPGGYLKMNESNRIQKIVEKPQHGKEPSSFVNVVVHYHPYAKLFVEILEEELKVKNGKDDIYERALQKIFDRGIIYRAQKFAGFWQPIKYPWHVLDLMNSVLEKAAIRRKGKEVEIAKTARIHGKVYMEDGVKVLDNAVIQGPAYIGKNTVIATNALVRNSHIGDACVIGFGSEIARSFIGDNVWTHANYIGDSVIGNDVSFGSGSATGNLRLDEKNIAMNIKDERVDSGINKLGLITGDHIRVGVNTSFMPGVKVGSDSFIGAGIVVAQDIPDKSFVKGDFALKITENREKITPRNR